MRLTAACLSCLAIPAFADAPKVATDILPVQGIVASVMQGVGTPDVILPPGADPHAYAMRPSEAQSLAEADLVVWISPSMTPWLERSITNLAEGANVIQWDELDGITLLEARRIEDFGGEHDHDHGHGHDEEHAEAKHDDHDHDHDHGDDHAKADHDDHDHGEEHADEAKHDDHDHDHDHDHGDDHAEADHDDHDHGEEHAEAKHDDHDHDHGEEHAEAGHDDHDHDDHKEEAHAGHDHDHDHDHGAHDPHLWLSPDNAVVLIDAVAAQLSEMDAAHADAYAANADAAKAEIATTVARVTAAANAMQGKPYLVGHDSYAYVEVLGGLTPAGAFSLYDGAAPTPAELSAVTEALEHDNIACIFIEPSVSPQLVSTFIPEDVAAITLDQLGTDLEPGAGHFPALLNSVADAFEACAATE